MNLGFPLVPPSMVMANPTCGSILRLATEGDRGAWVFGFTGNEMGVDEEADAMIRRARLSIMAGERLPTHRWRRVISESGKIMEGKHMTTRNHSVSSGMWAVAVCLVLCLSPASAQTPADTLIPPASPLLPGIMGPMEKMLWGKQGMMRSMGFPLTEESREREAFLRRNLLTAHQVGGFLTLAAMAATVVTGQLLLNSESNSDGTHAGHAMAEEHDHGLHTAKVALAWSTVGLYSVTALLSIATPPPMIRKDRWSSISWHKALAVGHFTGMFVTPFFGLMIEDNQDAKLFHQVTGYATLTLLTGAMLVVTF